MLHEDMWIKYKGKVFATWSGNNADVDKSMIKSIANKKRKYIWDKIRSIRFHQLKRGFI
jgi:hypothetical protein